MLPASDTRLVEGFEAAAGSAEYVNVLRAA